MTRPQVKTTSLGEFSHRNFRGWLHRRVSIWRHESVTLCFDIIWDSWKCDGHGIFSSKPLKDGYMRFPGDVIALQTHKNAIVMVVSQVNLQKTITWGSQVTLLHLRLIEIQWSWHFYKWAFERWLPEGSSSFLCSVILLCVTQHLSRWIFRRVATLEWPGSLNATNKIYHMHHFPVVTSLVTICTSNRVVILLS